MSITDRGKHIEGLRQWARVTIAAGKPVGAVHASLVQACSAVLSEFRTEFDAPGCRYWEYWTPIGTLSRFITGPGDAIPADVVFKGLVELTRDEYLARSGLQFGYGDQI